MVITTKFDLETKRQFEIIDITKHVSDAVARAKVADGLVTVFSPHTTASIRLNHFEPLLAQDLMKLMYRLAPIEDNYAHDFFEIRTNAAAMERSNGHAHAKQFLAGSSESIPVTRKQLALGARQSILFVEFDGGRKRNFFVSITS